ncbi:MAG TPA: hypothetical protein VLH13_01220, partial [Methanomassiliicoccales archaeon]|nr:hypothetical protein [Methanomassiliicoccales archaeon]
MEAHEPLKQDGRPVKDLFPYGTVREGQRQFLDDARSCIANRVNLLAHAPTGLGKTAVALTAALETTLSIDGTVFFLTARHSQHEAAVETARQIWRSRRFGLVDIISREASCLCRSKEGRMPCLESGDCYFLDQGRIAEAAQRLLDYPLHVGEAQRLCVRLGACPYLAAMNALPLADVVVCDLNQVFDRDALSFIDRCGTEVEGICLVVDEAHNLPGRISENRSVSISRAAVSSAMKATGHRNFKSALHALLGYIDSCVFDEVRPLPSSGLDVCLMESVGMDAATLADEMETYYQGRMRRRMGDIVSFLGGWNAYGDAGLRFADPSEGVLHSKFMEPELVVTGVLEKVRCALLMSGTLHPPELFADLLGMGSAAVCRRYPSPFPEQNRLILALDDVTSRYDRRGERTYDLMAERVSQV